MIEIDFYEKKKQLHEEMLEAIRQLFILGGISEIDLMPEGELQRHAYVILSPDGCDSVHEAQVMKVFYEDDELSVEVNTYDGRISLEYAGIVVTDTLETLYEAVYGHVADINREYFMLTLDETGQLDGMIEPHTWRIEYAEQIKELHGFVYDNYNDAFSRVTL